MYCRTNLEDARGVIGEYVEEKCQARNTKDEKVAKESDGLNEPATGGRTPGTKAIHQATSEQAQREGEEGRDSQCRANDWQSNARHLKVEEGEGEIYP